MCSWKKGPRIRPESRVSGQHPPLASPVGVAADKSYRSHLSARDKIWYCQKHSEHLVCDTPVFGLVTLPEGCYCVCLEEPTITADDDGFIFKCWKDTDDGAASVQWPADTTVFKRWSCTIIKEIHEDNIFEGKHLLMFIVLILSFNENKVLHSVHVEVRKWDKWQQDKQAEWEQRP